MLALDKESLICDFAETYHIFDLESVSAEYAAILAVGLRDNSRIKMKLAGTKADMNMLLLARIADNTALNIYAKTRDARTGRNRPKSLVDALVNGDKQLMQYASGASFMEEWERLNGN